MSIYELILTPLRGNSVKLELSAGRMLTSDLDRIIPDREYIYSDQPYHAEIRGLEEDIETFSFFVNDVEIKQNLDIDGKIRFIDDRYLKDRIFIHNFGLIQIAIRITFKGQAGVTVYSKFISVLVANARTNLSVERMAEYIYCHREQLLLSGLLYSEQRHGLKPEAQKELGTQVQLLKDIVQVYNENINYFRLNAKFRLCAVGCVDNYEKAKSVSGRTLSYIAQHPEQLLRTSMLTGIRINKQNYLPSKTLIEEASIDYDIYENQIIVGFLKSIRGMVCALINEIANRIERFPDKKEIENGYFLSAAFVFATTKWRLEKNREQLELLLENIEELYLQYCQILPVSERLVLQIPPPSAILISVRSYKLVYEQIIRWFQFGMYDFSREDFILPMLQSNKLYEYYVLLKLYNYIERKGYRFQKADPYNYKRQKTSNYEYATFFNIKTNNTFIFQNDVTSKQIILYYEPIIHGGVDKNVGENEVSLFRNTSFSYKEGETGKDYCPDYILKISEGSKDYYVILDAKFSNQKSVEKYYIRELLYKYLLSISTINPEDTILGLTVINGKSKEMEDSIYPYDIYDLVPNDQSVCPFAKIITVTENHEDSKHNEQLHIKLLDNLLASVFNP